MDKVGEYELVRRLGVGGMAETFLAIRERPGGFVQRVCLKRILPAFANDPTYRGHFEKEAKVAAQLSHMNIVGVIDYIVSERDLYLVFELIFEEGMAMRDRLQIVPGHPDDQ